MRDPINRTPYDYNAFAELVQDSLVGVTAGLLLAGVSSILYMRLPAITSGTSAPVDVVLFLLWVALFLAPIFSEINLFGIQLKHEVKALKEEVSGLRNDIRNSVDVRTQINPTFHVPLPPPDSQLPALEARLRSVMVDVLREHGVERPQQRVDIPSVSDDVALLFNARYHVERELRRIAAERLPLEEGRRPLPVFHIARVLSSQGLLDPRLAHAVREVYVVASPAIHGEPVSDAKVAFVREITPELISTLKAIRTDNPLP